MGPLTVTQITLVSTSLMMAVPALMIVVCLFIAKPGMAKWVNIVVGIAYTLVNIGNLIGESWAYYLIYGAIEISITVFITIMAFRWPKRDHQQEV